MSSSLDMIAAVKAGDLARVNELLDADASLVDLRSETGDSAFLIASYYGQRAVAETLLSRGAKLNIFEAAVAGDMPRVAAFLRESPNLARAYSHDGWTALHLAAYFGQRTVAEALLAGGADVNARTKNSQNNLALHAAAAGKHRDIVSLLLAHGAEVNARQEGGWTALHAAAQDGDTKMIAVLLAHGADVNARNDAGQTPLAIAAEHDQIQAVELLRQQGGTA